MVVDSIRVCIDKVATLVRDCFDKHATIYKSNSHRHHSHHHHHHSQRHHNNHQHHHHHHNHNSHSPHCSSSQKTQHSHNTTTTTNNNNGGATFALVTADINASSFAAAAAATLSNNGTMTSSSALPHGFSKRKTSQGQIYFVGPDGCKSWYDPRVPEELLCTQLDLDSLIGKLSDEWEVRHTRSGRVYFANHKRMTTQFTDPRLVGCKDYLLILLKVSVLRHETRRMHNNLGPCKIDISRKKIFEESFRTISQIHPEDLKRRLVVKFKNEEGLDYGGITREWFYLLSREMLNPNHGLFLYTGDDIYNLQINPDSGIVYREHLSYMNFCGRILGMAVFHGHFIDGHFILPFYKMLLGKSIKLSDIRSVDPDLHSSLRWLLKNDISDGSLETTFSVTHNAFGQLQEYDLKPNGSNVAVTEDNKHEYVSLYVNYRCSRGIQAQFDALLRGFHELIPPKLLVCFNEHELDLLIGGISRLDTADWKLHTRLKNCHSETPLVIWFWNIVESYSENQRARLLQFVTGSSRVPIQGFRGLQGINSKPRLFTLHVLRNASTDDLPKAHTCFNRLDLPMYENYDKLKDKLTQAIEETQVFAMQ